MRREDTADFRESVEHIGEGSRADSAQVRFEFGECHLDWVQVGAVGRQEQEPASGFAHGFGGGGIPVRGEVVQDDNGARFEFWYQHLFDVGGKGLTIHRALDDPGCNQRVGAEACDEGLRAP